MKKQILSLLIGVALISSVYAGNETGNSNNEAANAKAVKNFRRQFKDVSNETWYALSNVLSAEFILDGRKTTAVYSKKGSWLYTIQHYNADNLPVDLVDRVKTEYDKYYISAIEKVDCPATDAVYIVHLENTKSYKTIKVDKDNIELLQEFKKA